MNSKTKRLAESGIFIALSLVLSIFPVFKFPFGGSITFFSMLPIVLISYRHGIKWGLSCGAIYGVLQILVSTSVWQYMLPGEEQMLWYKCIIMCLLDYIIAYAALGLGGLFRKKSPTKALLLGSVISVGICYIAHVLSGAIFFGTYAEWFFTDVMSGSFGSGVLNNFSGFSLAMIYSLIYNGCYMIPEIILTTLAAVAIGKFAPIQKNCKSFN